MTLVVVFSLRLGLGGAESMAVELAKAYKILGYDVLFLYAEGEELLDWEGVECHKLDLPFLRGTELGDSRWFGGKLLSQLMDLYNPYGVTLFEQEVRRYLSGRSVNIFHFNKFRGLSPLVFNATKKAFRCRVYYTAHDYELLSPNAKKSLRCSILGRAYRFIRKPDVDAVFCPSIYVRDVLVECFPSVADRFILLENFCFESGVVGQQERPVGVFGFLGRLEPLKGIVQLCKAFHGCEGLGTLLIAGDGSIGQSLRNEYESESIRFLGVKKGSEKEDFLKNITYLVVPSVWEEVYGLVVVEALYYGVPVIVSDQGGLPELIDDRISGFVLRLEDILNVKAFRTKLLELNVSEKIKIPCGENSLACVRSKVDFSEDLARVVACDV